MFLELTIFIGSGCCVGERNIVGFWPHEIRENPLGYARHPPWDLSRISPDASHPAWRPAAAGPEATRLASESDAVPVSNMLPCGIVSLRNANRQTAASCKRPAKFAATQARFWPGGRTPPPDATLRHSQLAKCEQANRSEQQTTRQACRHTSTLLAWRRHAATGCAASGKIRDQSRGDACIPHGMFPDFIGPEAHYIPFPTRSTRSQLVYPYQVISRGVGPGPQALAQSLRARSPQRNPLLELKFFL